MAIESSFQDMLLKVVLFVVVQALVYLILSGSSNIFSKRKPRPNSFRPARSISIRRMLAVLADMPAGGEPSPSPKDLNKQSQPDPAVCTSPS
ncbi:uncharacterized protein LOC127786663 [Diospyros lotus]|uniref:uncharacterized protein LOC127786663 n=1 Tax=Diospyros lotus TaxID=55363 RepID=UPI0022548756|nr:uncharacterized protein LOC127786663 [Diospyros lotus]